MTTLSDTLTISLVLLLLFGSIALYLYTRIQQAEQKLSLLESILLDLKMSSEVKSYAELPAHEIDIRNEEPLDTYISYDTLNAEAADVSVDKEVDTNSTNSTSDTSDTSNKNYDTMTLKELQSIAKQRGIAGNMKKGQLVEALKSLDNPGLDTTETLEESNAN